MMEPQTPTFVAQYNFVKDEPSLRLWISSIFQKKNLSPVHLRLLQDMLPRVLAGENPEFLLDVLQGSIKKIFDENLISVDELNSLIDAVFRHQSNSNSNISAYNSNLKRTPEGVYWPNPSHQKYPRSLYKTEPFVVTNKILTRSTPIVAAGSCFAAEIAKVLLQSNFNYLIPEAHTEAELDSLPLARARWGDIFNTPSMAQLVEKAFGVKKLPRILIDLGMRDNHPAYVEPYREDLIFQSVEEYERDHPLHLEAAREALLRARVFIITLGMNEVWYFKSDGTACSRSPWTMAPFLVERRVLTVQQNVEALNRMLTVYRIFNPDVQVICTVSPVPLHATFRGDQHHVVAANAHSKSTLRVAAEEFCNQNDGVYYFPAYEQVMYCTENAWEADQRHVNRIAVKKVLNLFGKMFMNHDLD